MSKPHTRSHAAAGKLIADMLSGGDRRSLGRVDEVIALLAQEPDRYRELVGCLWANDARVRMRAADALEKLSRTGAGTLLPFKAHLLGLMSETTQKEVRWHLALLVPRLRLTRLESQRVCALLQTYLDDPSSIVKTFAMQGLADLSLQHPELRAGVIDLLRSLALRGTPAMRARGRILLAKLEGA